MAERREGVPIPPGMEDADINKDGQIDEPEADTVVELGVATGNMKEVLKGRELQDQLDNPESADGRTPEQIDAQSRDVAEQSAEAKKADREKAQELKEGLKGEQVENGVEGENENEDGDEDNEKKTLDDTKKELRGKDADQIANAAVGGLTFTTAFVTYAKLPLKVSTWAARKVIGAAKWLLEASDPLVKWFLDKTDVFKPAEKKKEKKDS